MAVTIVGNNTPTAGGVVYGDGTNYASTAAGTSGQVLQSNGASAPSWAAPATGALVFISTQTVSSSVAQVDFTSGITSTYDDYLLIYEAVVGPTKPGIRVQKSGTFQTTNYNYVGVQGQTTTPTFAAGGGDTKARINGANGISGSNLSFGCVYLLNANNATGQTCLTLQGGSVGATGTANYANMFYATQTTSAVVTGLRFYDDDANNLTAGTFRLYGIQKS
jgi:hypothetical protein